MCPNYLPKESLLSIKRQILMKVFYISPSVMPSRSANSVHVVRMCEAFLVLGHQVTLCVNQTVPSRQHFLECLEDYYGVCLKGVRIISFYTRYDKGINIRIALLSLREYLKQCCNGTSPDLVISRNLYASYAIRFVASGKQVFETHQLERGVRQWIQKKIIQDPRMRIVVISKALAQVLSQRCDVISSRMIVIPDAAPVGSRRLSHIQKRDQRLTFFDGYDLSRFSLIVGYFGHLHSGRGIDLIRILAERHPAIAFFLFGGHPGHINQEKDKPATLNFIIKGFLNPGRVQHAMGLMDVLVMPYETKVSIGSTHADTTQWMSPMKMFEYMASGVPIVASKLPVLEEVLSHEYNCLLAEPNDYLSWSRCLERLEKDSELAEKVSSNAYAQYLTEYNWTTRASKVLQQVAM